jgi:hypothetical protein
MKCPNCTSPMKEYIGFTTTDWYCEPCTDAPCPDTDTDVPIFALIELYEMNGNNFPFTARWHNPGSPQHGTLAEVTGLSTKSNGGPQYFKVVTAYIGPALVADPENGYGWILVNS